MTKRQLSDVEIAFMRGLHEGFHGAWDASEYFIQAFVPGDSRVDRILHLHEMHVTMAENTMAKQLLSDPNKIGEILQE